MRRRDEAVACVAGEGEEGHGIRAEACCVVRITSGGRSGSRRMTTTMGAAASRQRRVCGGPGDKEGVLPAMVYEEPESYVRMGGDVIG